MIRSILAFSLAATLAASASAQCVVSGVTTTDFGAGSGFLAPAALFVGADTASCSLEWKLDAPTCCNTFVSQHFLVFGTAVDPVGLPLGAPFYAGSNWHIGAPLVALGPFPGTTGSAPIPPDPAFVGLALSSQAVLDYFTTIGLTHDFGVSQGVLVQFQ